MIGNRTEHSREVECDGEVDITTCFSLERASPTC